jgi:hypothetical protein
VAVVDIKNGVAKLAAGEGFIIIENDSHLVKSKAASELFITHLRISLINPCFNFNTMLTLNTTRISFIHYFSWSTPGKIKGDRGNALLCLYQDKRA